MPKILKKEVPVEKNRGGLFFGGLAFLAGAILTVATGGFGLIAGAATALEAGLTAGCVGAAGTFYGSAGLTIID